MICITTPPVRWRDIEGNARRAKEAQERANLRYAFYLDIARRTELSGDLRSADFIRSQAEFELKTFEAGRVEVNA